MKMRAAKILPRRRRSWDPELLSPRSKGWKPRRVGAQKGAKTKNSVREFWHEQRNTHAEAVERTTAAGNVFIEGRVCYGSTLSGIINEGKNWTDRLQMVFFSCDACGESLKKNQVEKHLFKCRRCQALTCIDCQKEFWGEDYKLHVKCISENEKYGGKDYQPKPSAGKGEKSQESWISNIRNYIETTKISPAIEKLLTKLTNFDNVPRKKAKFKNFCNNCIFVRNDDHIDQIWEIFGKANEARKPPESSVKQSNQVEENKLKTQDIKSCEKTENGSESKSNPKTEDGQGKKKRKKKKKGGQSAVEPDLSKSQSEDGQNNEDSQSRENVIEQVGSDNTVKKHKKEKPKTKEGNQEFENSATDGAIQETEITPTDVTKKRKKKKHSKNDVDMNDSAIIDNNLPVTEIEPKVEIADDFVLNNEQVADAVPAKTKKKRSKNDVGVDGSTVIDNDDGVIEVKRKKKSMCHPKVGIQNDIEPNKEQESEDVQIKSKKSKKRKAKHGDKL